jgi:hypothetical protein
LAKLKLEFAAYVPKGIKVCCLCRRQTVDSAPDNEQFKSQINLITYGSFWFEKMGVTIVIDAQRVSKTITIVN